MSQIQTYKLGLRYKQLKSCLAEAKKQELLKPGGLLVSGWTVVEDRVVSGIFAPLEITNTANVDQRGLTATSAWFSAEPRRSNGATKNMLGFPLGLHQHQISEA